MAFPFSALEEAMNLRWLIQEFQTSKGEADKTRFQLVGASEVIYTAGLGACARYLALQDTSFVQRIFTFTSSRLHFGHPDCIDGYWCRFHIGLSPEIN